MKRLTLFLVLVVPLSLMACNVPISQETCEVKLADGWEILPDGSKVNFTVEGVAWEATLDCVGGQLVNGQPLPAPDGAKTKTVQVGQVTYELTSWKNVQIFPYSQNGSQIKIVIPGTYYVSWFETKSVDGGVLISYFMLGENRKLEPQYIYCFDRTEGVPHVSKPNMASIYVMETEMGGPESVNYICSGRDFILEVNASLISTGLAYSSK